MPVALIAGAAKWLLGQARSGQPAKQSKSEGYRADSIPNILTDSSHLDPEQVWGDEGPVND
jgi:hypothetical protein